MDDLLQPTPPPSPAPMQDMGSVMPEPSSSRMKTTIITLVCALVVFAGAFGAYWFLRSRPAALPPLPENPRELFLNGIHSLVQAKSFHLSSVAPLSTLAKNPALAQANQIAKDYGVDTANLTMLVDMDYERASATSTNIALQIGLTDSSKKTDLALGMRVVDAEPYFQLTHFVVPEPRLTLDALVGTWVHLNLKEIMQQFTGAMGEETQTTYTKRMQVMNAIQPDREKYFQLFADAWRVDMPVTLQYGDVTAQRVVVRMPKQDPEAMRRAAQTMMEHLVPKLAQQYIGDVDAAIAREQAAGRADVVEGLQEYRTETTEQFGENGSKAAEMTKEIFAQQMQLMPTSTEAYDGEMVFDRKTGRILQMQTWMLNDDGTRQGIPASSEFSMYNEPLGVEKPSNAKTIQDMFPIILGIVMGSAMDFSQDSATSTSVSDNPVGDTDGDSILDKDEMSLWHTDPKNRDTDGDGLDDAQELYTYESDPLKPDTDNDGFKDGDEVKRGFNPAGAGKLDK